MAQSIEKRFGEALARLRRERGLSQEQLEGVVHRTYISELERGLKSPTLGTVVKLSEALGVSPAYLVGLATASSEDALTSESAAVAPQIEPENAGLAFNLADVLTRALLLDLGSQSEGPQKGGVSPVVRPENTLADVGRLVSAAGGHIERVMAETALLVFREREGAIARTQRNSLRYWVADQRSTGALTFTDDPTMRLELQPDRVLETVMAANRTLELIHDLCGANNVDVFRFLGLRNLSSFVGEIFKNELWNQYPSELLPNPHQDGYPDLMALTPQGSTYIEERRKNGQMTVKSSWSPYPFGGLEVKATCGITPPARVKAKPEIGESRWPIVTGADWKAHHRNTNYLLGIYWDFVNGLPTVLAVFYCNSLEMDDWGKVVEHKEDGGNSTSVSVMKRPGVLKMGQGWLVLPRDEAMRRAFAKKSVFGVTDENLSVFCSDYRDSVFHNPNCARADASVGDDSVSTP